MSSNSDILAVLFTNLRNAAQSYGTTSPQYQVVHEIVHDHLKKMAAEGEQTSLSRSRQAQQARNAQIKETEDLTRAFENLDLELKGEDKMQE